MAFNYSFYSALSCIFAILSTVDFVLLGILIRNITIKNTFYRKENKIVIICFIILFLILSFSSALFSSISYSAKVDLIKSGVLTCFRETEHYNVYCNLTNNK